MPYPIERKLVVGVSTSALFDLRTEDSIYNAEGYDAYRHYQKAHIRDTLPKGAAFPFVRRFLNINRVYPDKQPVEVVLLSKNSPETGLRAFHSIRDYGLPISRAAFLSGGSPFSYISPFNISLFLSINNTDVVDAIQAGHPAGRILDTVIEDDEDDSELRVAFDFDGVLADDAAERVYQESKQLEIFHQHESDHAAEPLNPGLLAEFFMKLSFFQKIEAKKVRADPNYKRILRTAIITARNAPAHERAINTLESWEVTVDEMFLLGGIEKARILRELKPHLFIDDQVTHLDPALENIPLVHIPFGIANSTEPKA